MYHIHKTQDPADVM